MERSFAAKTAPRDPLVGRVLHDRYRVERRIGKGGMGIVYLAEHVLLRRKVALKVLSERAFASEEMVARFHREATAAAAVGNEHVVGVTDMGQLDDGTFFVVLEYLDGVELGHAIAEQGPFGVQRAVRLVLQLCEALAAVHAAGIVHRDLKPENLFLVERNGEPDFLKVLDFGVCKVLDVQRSGERSLTDTGVSLGTPQFMAPEQIQDSARVDERTDIYAAGAILYFALTGRAAFEDSTLPRLLMRICSEPPPPIRLSRPELPLSIEGVIARAMAMEPRDRFQTADALRDALLPFVRAEEAATVRLEPRSAPEPPEPSSEADSVATVDRVPRRGPLSRRATRIAMVALLACALLALGLALARRGAQEEVTTIEAATAPTTSSALELDLSPALAPEPEPEPRARALAGAPPPARADKRPKRAAASVAANAEPAPEPLIAPAPAVAPPAPEVPPEEPPQPEGPEGPLSKRKIQDVFP